MIYKLARSLTRAAVGWKKGQKAVYEIYILQKQDVSSASSLLC